MSTSDFLTAADFENVEARQNAHQNRFNISGKLDFKPAKNTFLSLGGSYYAKKSRDFSAWRSMFSWEDNRESSEYTYRFFGKLTQKFGSAESNEENSSTTIKNAFITLQADYTNNKNTDRLIKLGIKIYLGHNPKNLDKATMVVVSSAIKKNNKELIASKNKKLSVVKRGEMLANIVALKKI